MPVTVLNVNGEGQDSDVIAGVIWAADHGANVILMAFSNPGFSPNLQDAIDYAWSKGIVLVAAAGNNGVGDPTFPAGDRGVMGVAATDANDALAYFSNDGQAVFIAAPGRRHRDDRHRRRLHNGERHLDVGRDRRRRRGVPEGRGPDADQRRHRRPPGA